MTTENFPFQIWLSSDILDLNTVCQLFHEIWSMVHEINFDFDVDNMLAKYHVMMYNMSILGISQINFWTLYHDLLESGYYIILNIVKFWKFIYHIFHLLWVNTFKWRLSFLIFNNPNWIYRVGYWCFYLGFYKPLKPYIWNFSYI